MTPQRCYQFSVLIRNRLLSRNGENEISCLKGDSYLHDITNTKGHTFPLTDGKWHPIERNIFITSSRDSTIRIWDIYSKQMGIDLEIMQSTILRAKTFKNHKIPVTSCNYSNDGKMIIGGGENIDIHENTHIGTGAVLYAINSKITMKILLS